MDSEKRQVVASYASRERADNAASILLSNSIQAEVEDAASSSAGKRGAWGSSFKVLVAASDYGRARQLLNPSQSGVRQLLTLMLVGGLLAGAFYFMSQQKKAHFTGVVDKSGSGSGKPDNHYYYEDGKLVRLERDRNHDGKTDAWTWYSNGRTAKAELDDNFDGKVDEWVSYDNGYIRESKIDTDFNGVPDLFITYHDGLVTYREWRPQSCPKAIKKEYYENGRKVRQEVFSETTSELIDTVYFDAFERPAKTPRLEQ